MGHLQDISESSAQRVFFIQFTSDKIPFILLDHGARDTCGPVQTLRHLTKDSSTEEGTKLPGHVPRAPVFRLYIVEETRCSKWI